MTRSASIVILILLFSTGLLLGALAIYAKVRCAMEFPWYVCWP